MKYTIGEFSEMIGVTVDTLRLYEKRGIIKPIKDDNNNYRYFNDLDARVLLTSRMYRSMQIPLENVADLINKGMLEDVILQIDESRRKLEDQIKKSTLLVDKMIEIEKETATINASLYHFKEKKLSGIYRLITTKKDMLLKHAVHKEEVSAWMNLMPYCFRCFRIDKDLFLSNQENFDYNWGLAIFEDDMKHFDLKITENIEYIKPQTYLFSVFPSVFPDPIDDYFLQNVRDFIISYIAKNDFKVTGDIIGKLLLTQKMEHQTLSYLAVYIPISERSVTTGCNNLD